MKHLQTYKLFESIDAEIKSNIEDIALELTDCEIYYEISARKYWKNNITPEEALIIYLRHNKNRFFTIKDIEDVILRLKDYLKTTDYSIDLSIPDSDDYMTFDEFIEDFSDRELYHVNMIIYYNPRISSFQRKYTAHEDFYESVNESTKSVLKDILLPISDMGYEISVEEYAATPQLVIRVVSWTDEPLLITDEIKEEFMRMKDYLESEGYNSILAKYWRANSVSSERPFDYFINNAEGHLSNLLFVVKKI